MASRTSDWPRTGALILVVLGVAFAIYGRLVKVETRLATLEQRVSEIHGKLFGTRLAERK